MYLVRIGAYTLPVAPSKIVTKLKGGNKTIDLISQSEVNMLKSPKLEEITFDAIFPYQHIPMETNIVGRLMPNAYAEAFKEIMYKKKPVKLVVTRYIPGLKTEVAEEVNGKVEIVNPASNISMMVTIENLQIEENAENGLDWKISFTLKKYVDYGVKKVTISNNTVSTAVNESFYSKVKSDTYTVKKGDTLLLIAKKYYGSSDKATRTSIYTANKTVIETAAKKNGKKSSANGKFLFKGTKLKMPSIIVY